MENLNEQTLQSMEELAEVSKECIPAELEFQITERDFTIMVERLLELQGMIKMLLRYLRVCSLQGERLDTHWGDEINWTINSLYRKAVAMRNYFLKSRKEKKEE